MVEARGNSLSAVEHGPVRVSRRLSLSGCLGHLYTSIQEVVDRTHPQAAAIEGVFYCKNIKTVLMLGEARGVVIAAFAARGIPVYEYAPRRVKQAVVGVGGAEKEQVAKMVMTLLALPEEPQEDAADALAVAICHLHNRTGCAALMPEAI